MQERFLTVKPDKVDESFQWWVPITFTSPEKGFDNTYNDNLWHQPNEGSKEVAGMPDSDVPVIFNVQQTGKQDIFDPIVSICRKEML